MQKYSFEFPVGFCDLDKFIGNYDFAGGKRKSIRTKRGAFLIISALVSSVAGSLPTIIAQSGYSRQFEREADESAARYFMSKGWSVKPLQDILLRMSKDRQNSPAESLLSTHPLAKERVEYLQAMEKKLRE